jgi:uncharacterized membrane protein
MLGALSWGAPGWLYPAAALLAVALVLVFRSYLRPGWSRAARAGAAILKAAALAAIALCLLEPLRHGTRPRPGANLFVILADGSRSMNIRGPGETESRGEKMQAWLRADAPWQVRLAQDFDVRRYVLGGRLEPALDFNDLALDRNESALGAGLEAIARRYRDRPIAGVLLFSDGNATDLDGRVLDASGLPPIYPVVAGGAGAPRDVAVRGATATLTNFESAPVTIQADVSHHGLAGEDITVRLIDAGGALVEEVVRRADDSGRIPVRFEVQPRGRGLQAYRVLAGARGEIDRLEKDGGSSEATLANNARLVMVDRARGPYRVLYVSGRPNWELKFLRRALEEDEEVELVGLIRIAKREPKFEFRSRFGESTNPLFRGFGNQDREDVEQYDQPVLVRLGTTDAEELKGGFPRAAEQLFRYDAVILDDVEAEYFTHEQMSLLRDFVAKRGGGFLMLGGQESFAKGGYARTPIGDLCPVYLDQVAVTLAPSAEPGWRLDLTREGEIEPWVRLRKTEEAERRRLEEMPAFLTFNPTRGIKPGATVLLQARDGGGSSYPALVEQRFGKGRAGALLVGDLWRWGLRRQSLQDPDLEKAWRQTIRWLVGDVPRRVEGEVEEARGPGGPARIVVRARGETYEPLENASVAVRVSGPAGEPVELTADASETESGSYEVEYVSRVPGAHRAAITVKDPEGKAAGEREIGWIADPESREYRDLEPDRALLERLARESGGEVVDGDRLDAFAAGLPDRRIPITDPWTYPLWHRWSVLLFAVACLAGEWALRRWKGLP